MDIVKNQSCDYAPRSPEMREQSLAEEARPSAFHIASLRQDLKQIFCAHLTVPSRARKDHEDRAEPQKVDAPQAAGLRSFPDHFRKIGDGIDQLLAVRTPPCRCVLRPLFLCFGRCLRVRRRLAELEAPLKGILSVSSLIAPVESVFVRGVLLFG